VIHSQEGLFNESLIVEIADGKLATTKKPRLSIYKSGKLKIFDSL